MKLLTIILGGFLVINSIQAEVSSYVAFDRETRAIIEAGDAIQGKLKAASMKCDKCHGENGQGDDDVSVAGHPATYIYKQLKDFKDKKRDGTMVKKVKKLTNQDMADFSAWYASLSFAKGVEGGGQLAIDLVYKGDPKRMLKPCSTCHGQNGEGGKYDAAAITGQNKDAFIEMMEAFKESDRTNDIYSRMRLIAKVLTTKEIQALADYYSAPEME
ncbi:cytochrome c class I [Abyssogena phaseoliformis symbiont OG214]|uniref:c-type cytochrome n=1 Tax=Abyssogena phaseoliformis symbiont TaxID=596095 RepID=UPI0019154F15|nr:cytochrome c4 [Abyssogena phaseoliformis symbiont]MBW5289159.1 Cytochrome c4 [Candidatus Ruthia sp. Apha_13_S6]BBB22543.1 cytochrome c class I [Abyssogena phaseoliformis symbiont OG214]